MLQIDSVEVLAHVTAPSAFQDDTRYRAQAAAMAAFEACSKLKVYGREESFKAINDYKSLGIATEDTSFDTSLSFSAWRRTDTVTETPAQHVTRQLLRQNLDGWNLEPLISRESIGGPREHRSERNITWRVTKNQAPCQNSAYKTPSFHREATAPHIHATRSPKVPRPKTVPAGSIPFSAKTPRKRVHSESSSFESLRSVVPDSQEQAVSNLFQGSVHPADESTTYGGHASISTAQTAVHRWSNNPQTRPAKRQKATRASSAPHESETPNLAHLLDKHNANLARTERIRRVSHDSTQIVTTSSDSTSTWPPKERSNMTYPPVPAQAHSTEPHLAAFRSIPAPMSQAEVSDNWSFSQTPPVAAADNQRPSKPVCLAFSSISSLPTAIHAPSPPVGHAHYTTHLTSPLRHLAIRLSLPTRFRPILVKRDINVLERGYWYLHIPMVPSSPTRMSESDTEHGDARRTKERPWTEAAFLQTWRALTYFIQTGQAGWGASLYREEPLVVRTTTPPLARPEKQAESTQTRDIILKVTCWGEIVAHIYLLLWALSDKRTEVLGMEWRDAGEEVVVKMAKGSGNRGARLGKYGFKGGEGVDGRWGIITEREEGT